MKKLLLIVAMGSLLAAGAATAQAPSLGAPAVNAPLTPSPSGTANPVGIQVRFSPDSKPEDISQTLQIVLLLTVLSLAPSIIVMTTSFTRILIVFGFLRQALGTQQVPSGQIIAGLALFMSAFIMAPVWKDINTNALQPYIDSQITQAEAWDRGVKPLRAFMLSQTGNDELGLFLELAGKDQNVTKLDDVGMEVILPAFMISELKTSFQLGFLIYLPFLVIDLVVSTILMSLGMMMLPPMMISLPIKLLFFVLADGWNLTIRGLVSSFRM